MTFKLQEEFHQHTSASSTLLYADRAWRKLLSKRGFSTQYVGYTDPQGQVVVSAVLYSMPRLAALHMKSTAALSHRCSILSFYQALQALC